METGLYLFCFGRSEALAAWRPASGIFTAPAGPVAAVLAEVAVDEFRGEDAERRLQDLAWLAPRACRHEEVVEEAMRFSPVLPARFGTIFSTRARLEQLAERHGAAILEFLERVSGRQEWGLKGLLDAAGFREAVRAETARRAGESLAPGARYLKERAFRAGAERAVRASMGAYCRQVLEPLPFPWRSRTAAVECLASFALLLPQEEVELFRAAVARAQDAAPRGLLLRASGPWPPYSFAPDLATAEP